MSGLVVSGAEVKAGDKSILAGASFSAAKGTVTGLLGPNGAGKSTLIAAVLGLARLAAGRISFEGKNVPDMRPAQRARICAYVEQFATTTERLTVRDVVALGRVPFQSAWQAAAAARDDQIVAAALDALGMTAFAARLYHSLSGGEQQRVQIARALAQEPQLLLLDEPTSHLDIGAQLLVLETLRRRADDGCTVVVALHDLNLAARHCDRLVILERGRVVAEGAAAEVLNPTLLREVYGVEASIVQPPGSSHPLVVYNRATVERAGTKPD